MSTEGEVAVRELEIRFAQSVQQRELETSQELFEKLTACYQPRIIRMIAYLIRSRRLAEDLPSLIDDLWQEAMVRAWRYRSSYDSKKSFVVWLSVIARNVVNTYFQKLPSIPEEAKQVRLDGSAAPRRSSSKSRTALFQAVTTDIETTQLGAEEKYRSKEFLRSFWQYCKSERHRRLFIASCRRYILRQHWKDIVDDMGWNMTQQGLYLACKRLIQNFCKHVWTPVQK